MDLVGGGVDSRGGYVLKILYVKMKELGPLGGVRPPVDPPMHLYACQNDISQGASGLLLDPVLNVTSTTPKKRENAVTRIDMF